MLSGMRMTKRIVQIFAGLFLLAMFGIPLAGAWLDAHPDTRAAIEGAADNVDPEGGFFRRSQQFASGLSKSRAVLAEEKRERADDKVAEERERKANELRRFNTGQLVQEDN